MKELRIYQLSPDGERVDEIVFRPGALLRDVDSQSRNNPLVIVSQLVGVQLIDTEAAEAARAERRRLTAYFLDNDEGRPRPERQT